MALSKSVIIICCLLVFATRELFTLEENVEIKSFSMKFKSIKCIANKPEYLAVKFCFVKPVSRSTSTLNVGYELLKDYMAPSEVRY